MRWIQFNFLLLALLAIFVFLQHLPKKKREEENKENKNKKRKSRNFEFFKITHLNCCFSSSMKKQQNNGEIGKNKKPRSHRPARGFSSKGENRERNRAGRTNR